MKNSALIKLQALTQQHTLPHAWLLTGLDHATKLALVQDFAKWLLCIAANKDVIACGTCKSCLLFAANTHPDYCVLTVAPDKKSITVDEVRALHDYIPVKPQLAQHKIVLLYQAEDLNTHAANSLLKNLEEPVSNTIFFLLVKHQSVLLPTIVSRCQQLNFSNNLQIQDAAALLAVEQITRDLHSVYLENYATTSEIVDKWVKQWPHEVLYWIELVLADLILLKYTQDLSLLKCPKVDYAALMNFLPTSKLWAMLERLRRAQYWFGTNHKPNLQLIVEDVVLTK
jgi:hypothetical protein